MHYKTFNPINQSDQFDFLRLESSTRLQSLQLGKLFTQTLLSRWKACVPLALTIKIALDHGCPKHNCFPRQNQMPWFQLHYCLHYFNTRVAEISSAVRLLLTPFLGPLPDDILNTTPVTFNTSPITELSLFISLRHCTSAMKSFVRNYRKAFGFTIVFESYRKFFHLRQDSIVNAGLS